MDDGAEPGGYLIEKTTKSILKTVFVNELMRNEADREVDTVYNWKNTCYRLNHSITIKDNKNDRPHISFLGCSEFSNVGLRFR